MSTIITALTIIISTITIPLILIYINKHKSRKRNQTFLKLFGHEIAAQGLAFSSQEMLRNKIIGFDGIKQKLLIFEFDNPRNIISIDMREVKKCTVEKKYDSILIGSERKAKLEPHLRSIDLKFTFKNRPEPVSVSFYESGVNSIYELQDLEAKANKWEIVLAKMIVQEFKVSA